MSIPEIQRVNLASTVSNAMGEARSWSLNDLKHRQSSRRQVLNLKAIGIEDVLNFDFMDQPDDDLLHAAIDELVSLSALDQDGQLTDIGESIQHGPRWPKHANGRTE